MNKKGFTFIELLAVIILISVITLIAIPTIKLANKKIEKKNYETKIELIQKAAENYGDDHKENILASSNLNTYTDTSTNVSYPSITIKVRVLLQNGYISKDPGLQTEDVLDPRNDTSLLNKNIIIYIKNNRSYAILDF